MHYLHLMSIESRQQLVMGRFSLTDNAISGKDKRPTSPMYFKVENRK